MTTGSDAEDGSGLAGRRVLVAEIEAVIALDLQAMLSRFGCLVSSFVTSAADALAMLAQERPDVALINPRLRDGSAMPFVEALRLAGVPFALVSDCKDNLDEPVLQDVPCLEWPYSTNGLRQTLLQLLQGQDQSPGCEANA